MPGLGRFARGKPQTPSGIPNIARTTGATPDASLPEEDEGNWMQFDVSDMDFGNFGGNNDAASLGYLDTNAHDDDDEEEEERQQQQVLPPPTNAPTNHQAKSTNGLGLNMFKNKAHNVASTNESTTTATMAIDNAAGGTALQATFVPHASATDLQGQLADNTEHQQDTPMAESHDSSLAMPQLAGRASGVSNASGATGGLAMFAASAGGTARISTPVGRQQTGNGGKENSAPTGLSWLVRASTDMNPTHDGSMNAASTGGSEKTSKVNAPNLTPRAETTEGEAAQVLPPTRGASTRVLPSPAKMAPLSVPTKQPARQEMNPQFASCTPQGQVANTTLMQPPKTPHQTQMARPANHHLQTPETTVIPANSCGSGNNNRQMNANPDSAAADLSLMKYGAPPQVVTPSPTNHSRPNNPIMGTTLLPPSKPSACPTTPHPNQQDDTTIVPPAATTTQASTTTQTVTDDSSSPTDDSTPDFNDLHAQFLSDIRDLEDAQNVNVDRLLSMRSDLAIAYSALLQDQFQFLRLLEKLEHFSQDTDQAIAKYQQQ